MGKDTGFDVSLKGACAHFSYWEKYQTITDSGRCFTTAVHTRKLLKKRSKHL